MKMKKILSLLLALVMISGICSLSVFADNADVNGISAYITMSVNGKIVEGKDGELVAEKPVLLTGGESYTLDDLFKTAHDLYYDGGSEAGYSSYMGGWGLSVGKLWGDESGNFSYQINGAETFVSGLSQEIKDGDYIDAYVFENSYPDSENYS